ncbi:TlpA family protein disulfide reductase [Acidimangrovimonas sediminis]|uniref:TlpA family protein disulfide reductase n=1 Tax=Acidimangrovimonas sediminis TaxID=2056283 RepID=UPI000C8015B2|nr:TlpA disulfide reductase family protein [Acidimangrovimonas sediminis]
MKNIRIAVLYTALALGANALAVLPAAAAMAPAVASADGLRAGDMKKLSLHADPKPVPDIAFQDADGKPHKLSEYRGKLVLVNFWATWCAPCRVEMPTLDKLQAEMGDRLTVLPIATIRNTLPAVQRFFKSDKIEHLPILIDPQAALAHKMGVMGLPVTLILNAQGEEIGRLIGEADWSGDDARAVLGALIGADG